jgi:pimeloyl-ACP methyl ester carboxylesterase
MVTVVLPGYSSHNKEWLEETVKRVNMGGEIRPIYWGHWSDPSKQFDPQEKARLIDNVAGKRMVDIIAKSIGTLVASYIIQESPEKIRKVIFCGLPLNGMAEEGKEVIKAALKLIPPQDIICFHNEEDPVGGLNQVKKFLSEINPNINLTVKPRTDHEYPYFDEFRDFLIKSS